MIISIKSRQDILRSRENSQYTLYGKFLMIIISKSPEQKKYKLNNFYRLLIVVTKKIHNKAVVRNKIKRRLKNAFKEIDKNILQLQYDYQIIAKNTILNANFNELKEDITNLIKNKKSLNIKDKENIISNKIKTSIALNINKKKDKNCIFCNKKDDIIYKTKNFYVKIGKAIITAGHIMIIPKKHFSCLADIDKSMYEEYFTLKDLVINKITKTYSKPFLIEHGIFMQSVFHAHIHIIPTSSSEYSYVNPIEAFVENDIKVLNTKLIEIKDFYELVDYFNKYKEYMYYEIEDKKYIMQVHKSMLELAKKKDIGYRGYFSRILKLKGVKGWKDMTEEEKKIDEIKIEKTKKELIF